MQQAPPDRCVFEMAFEKQNSSRWRENPPPEGRILLLRRTPKPRLQLSSARLQLQPRGHNVLQQRCFCVAATSKTYAAQQQRATLPLHVADTMKTQCDTPDTCVDTASTQRVLSATSVQQSLCPSCVNVCPQRDSAHPAQQLRDTVSTQRVAVRAAHTERMRRTVSPKRHSCDTSSHGCVAVAQCDDTVRIHCSVVATQLQRYQPQIQRYSSTQRHNVSTVCPRCCCAFNQPLRLQLAGDGSHAAATKKSTHPSVLLGWVRAAARLLPCVSRGASAPYRRAAASSYIYHNYMYRAAIHTPPPDCCLARCTSRRSRHLP